MSKSQATAASEVLTLLGYRARIGRTNVTSCHGGEWFLDLSNCSAFGAARDEVTLKVTRELHGYLPRPAVERIQAV